MIVARQLAKRFGAVHAVENVSFVASSGEITGLLGANGAGKTTTLRLISGLLRPDLGEVFIDGVSPQKDPQQAQRSFGILPDSRGLYPRLTARENVRYFADLYGVGEKTAAQRTDTLFAELGLSAVADRRVHGFSQGERAKVAIARALIHEPHNIILDEPTNGLDILSTRAMRSFIRARKAAGACVVLSTHILQEVEALCDQIVIVASGRVVASGTREALLEQAHATTLEDAYVALACPGHEPGAVA